MLQHLNVHILTWIKYNSHDDDINNYMNYIRSFDPIKEQMTKTHGQTRKIEFSRNEGVARYWSHRSFSNISPKQNENEWIKMRIIIWWGEGNVCASWYLEAANCKMHHDHHHAINPKKKNQTFHVRATEINLTPFV